MEKGQFAYCGNNLVHRVAPEGNSFLMLAICITVIMAYRTAKAASNVYYKKKKLMVTLKKRKRSEVNIQSADGIDLIQRKKQKKLRKELARGNIGMIIKVVTITLMVFRIIEQHLRGPLHTTIIIIQGGKNAK